MTAYELLCFLREHPNAKVVVIEGDDRENKKRLLESYFSADGEVVIQYWD